MDRPSYLSRVEVQRHYRPSVFISRFAGLALLTFWAMPGFAARVPVRDGQSVNLKLRNILTTDNVRKNDVIEFEVTEDILVNGHVVIARGATARAKISDVKGAYKPRDNSAEVVFQFLTVRAVDKQELPLRRIPERPRKASSKDTEVHEKSPIAGQIMRVVGADKGKEYQVYVNGAFTVTTSDTIVVAPAASPEAPPAAQPSAPVPSPAAPPVPATPMATLNVAATSSVEFDSTPDGADIVVDGNLLGNTHSTLHLTLGRHDIEIRMAGYHTWSRRMVVDPESHQSVRVTLVKQ